jgi:hypothetical protein
MGYPQIEQKLTQRRKGAKSAKQEKACSSLRPLLLCAFA